MSTLIIVDLTPTDTQKLDAYQAIIPTRDQGMESQFHLVA